MHSAGIVRRDPAQDHLRVFTNVMSKVNRIASGKPVKVVSSPRPHPHYPNVAGWTAEDVVYINEERVLADLRSALGHKITSGDTGPWDRMVLALLGLNYHELCHILYTPEAMTTFRVNVRNNGISFQRAWNIMEDQRIEMIFWSRYLPTEPYFTYMVLHWVLNLAGDKPTTAAIGSMYPFVAQRKYLPMQFRSTLRKAFIESLDEAVATGKITLPSGYADGFAIAEWMDSILKSFFGIVDWSEQSQIRKAMRLIADFDSILQLAKDATGREPEEFDPHEQQSGGKSKSTEKTKEDAKEASKMVEEVDEEEAEEEDDKGGYTPKDTDDEADDEEDDTDADGDGEASDEEGDEDESDDDELGSGSNDADDDDEYDDEVDDASDDDSDADADSEADGDDADADGADGDSDSDEGDTDGDGNGESQESDSTGDGAGHGQHEYESDFDPTDFTKDVQEMMDDLLDDEQVQDDLRATDDSIRDAMDKAEHQVALPQRPSSMNAVDSSHVGTTERMIHEIKNLRTGMEEHWVHEERSGRLNVRQAMKRQVVIGPPDVFDDWEPSTEAAGGVEIVVCLDVSGSMAHSALDGPAQVSAWQIKRMFDAIEMPCTILTFGSRQNVLYEAHERADLRKFKRTGSGDSSTMPSPCIREAAAIFDLSKQPNKVLFMVTDGTWDDSATSDQLIRGLNAHGVITALLYLEQRGSSTLTPAMAHGCKITKAVSNPSSMVDMTRAVVEEITRQAMSAR